MPFIEQVKIDLMTVFYLYIFSIFLRGKNSPAWIIRVYFNQQLPSKVGRANPPRYQS